MFDRGLTIGRIKGIPIRAHVTLLLFLPYVAFVASEQFSATARELRVPSESLGLPPLIWGAFLAVGLFASILLHELAHSLIALRDGAKVRSITLMMLGGVSQIENDVPLEREAWMAFAGPLVSFLIAVLSYGAARLVPHTLPGLAISLLVFALINGVIAVFNLLPAFPMDGGRILRGLLSRVIGPARATRVATTLGKGAGLVLGLVGLTGFNVILILIAIFVYMGASAEQVRLEARDFLRGVPVAQVMSDRLGDARADESANEVAGRLIRNSQLGARVSTGHLSPDGADNGRTVGLVTAWDLVRGADGGSSRATVGSAMRTEFPRVHVYDDAGRTLEVLASGDASIVAVLDEAEHVVGIVTPAEMQRAVALIEAMHRREGPSDTRRGV